MRDTAVAREIRLLRQAGDGGAGLGEARAGIGDGLAGQDAQQGRFAGAVAADQAQPLARRDGELDAVEDGLVAEVVADAGEGKQGRFGPGAGPGGTRVMTEPVPNGEGNKWRSESACAPP